MNAEPMVDATGTARRLQSLIAKGFAACQLAARLGTLPHDPSLTRLLSMTQVPASTDAAVRALFDELKGESPFDHGVEPRSYTAAKTRARRNRWALPDAWDEETIDDPAAAPVDAPRVPRPLVVAENYADLRERCGGNDLAIANRLGMRLATMQRNLLRARRLLENKNTHDSDLCEAA